MKFGLACIIVSIFISLPLQSQDIITGLDLFNSVAENYNQIEDYVANVTMEIDRTQMSGKIYYRIPNLIRIDFTRPNNQVLVSDGEVLKIYVPAYNVTLTQRLQPQSNLGAFASAQGLSLLRRNYQIAFTNSPDLQALSEENSSERVYKLTLTWRNSSQGFRRIEIDVTPELFIRRMTATSANYQTVIFTFTSFEINQGIPSTRFEYDSPPSSNNFDNFLYGAE